MGHAKLQRLAVIFQLQLRGRGSSTLRIRHVRWRILFAVALCLPASDALCKCVYAPLCVCVCVAFCSAFSALRLNNLTARRFWRKTFCLICKSYPGMLCDLCPLCPLVPSFPFVANCYFSANVCNSRGAGGRSARHGALAT